MTFPAVPWICPRCGTVNAWWRGRCSCKPPDELEQLTEQELARRIAQAGGVGVRPGEPIDELMLAECGYQSADIDHAVDVGRVFQSGGTCPWDDHHA